MLEKLLGVHPNEQKRLSIFFLLNLTLAVGITVGSTASLSLFIVRYGVQHLPLMFMLTSVLTIIVMSVYNNFLGRFSNEKYFLIILSLTAAVVLVVWRLVSADFRPVYLFLYPAYSIITTLSYSHTFVIVYDYFDSQESKRLFPLIASGISLGGMLGGFGVKALMKIANTQNLFLVWFVFIVLAAVMVALIRPMGLECLVKRQDTRKKSSLGFFAGFAANCRAVMKIPMVRVLIYSTMTVTIAFFMTDFLSNKIFSRVFPEEAKLTVFLGVFTGVSSLIGLVLQMAFLSRLLARIGVANANIIYPGFLFAGLAALLAWPALPAACLGYFNRKFLSYSIGEPVDRLLYNSLPAQMKGRASAFIKGYIVPVSTFIACAVIICINYLFRENARLSFTVLAAAGFGVSSLCIYQRFVLKRLYSE